jgi:8-amino-7-oxononanoate synthase
MAANDSAYDWLADALDTIHRADWHRSVREIAGLPGPLITLEGEPQPLVNFASNDYLGLAGDRRLIEAACAASHTYGTGSTGSRLLSGHRDLHDYLERAIATLKQTEAAIVFSSGYLANLGTVSALVGKRDLILTDQFNHSSLRAGASLSGATLVEYRHCDLSHLHQLLSQHRPNHRRCLILTESVFSMDGDLCPLPALLDLAEQFTAMVLIDDAHATGVLGQTGAGSLEHFGCTGRAAVQMGTLSKALGSLGGYVAGSATLIDFLRNRAPSWIYTTGLSPADTAAALAAIAIIQQEPQRRSRLMQHSTWLQTEFKQRFQASPYRLLPSDSPIVCLPVASPKAVLHLGLRLRTQGLFVSAVRPPTVPTSRLRITLMATHQRSHLEQLLSAFESILDRDDSVSLLGERRPNV